MPKFPRRSFSFSSAKDGVICSEGAQAREAHKTKSNGRENMRNQIRSLFLVGGSMVGLMALPNSGLSQAGLYLNAGAGVSIAEKVNVNKFGVPTSGVKADFDPGVRLSVA